MAGKPALCTLTQVEKRYAADSACVLGPLSLTVHAGEILGIRGRNGAGKSTLLSILAGVLSPSAGQRVLSPRAEGHVGYVPQELSLYTSLTGVENLKFWGLAGGLPSKAIAARSRWRLEQLDVRGNGRQAVRAASIWPPP